MFLTDPAAASGTDRVAEVARQMSDVDIVVNVQGDEPEIAGEAIDLAIQLLEDHPDAVMSTLATPIRTREQLDDPRASKSSLTTTAGRCTSAAARFPTLASGRIRC